VAAWGSAIEMDGHARGRVVGRGDLNKGGAKHVAADDTPQRRLELLLEGQQDGRDIAQLHLEGVGVPDETCEGNDPK